MRYLTVVIVLFLGLHHGMSQDTNRQPQGRERGGDGDGETYFYRETPGNFQLMYVTGAFEGKEHSNPIISEMGKLAGVQPPNSFKTVFNYVEKLNIDKVNDRLNLQMSLKQVGFSNLRDVYGFDMSPVLMPDRMNFRLQLLDNQGNVVYEQLFVGVDVSYLSKTRQYRELVHLTVEDEIHRPGGSLRTTEVLSPVAHLKFYHSAARKKEFFRMADLIPRYRQDAALLTAIIEKTKRYDLHDLDHLKEMLDELEDSKETVDRIGEMDYEKALLLKEKDPDQMLPMLAEFPTLYHEMKKDLQRLLRTLDDLYYQKGMSLFERRDYRKALVWFRKALDFNSSYAPAHYRVAWIDYHAGNVKEAGERAYRILESDMKMDARLSIEVNALLDEIHTRQTSPWLDQASTMISRGDYQRVDQLIDRISGYYSLYPLCRYSKAYTDLLYGYQLALLETGESLLKTKEFPMAYEVLQRCLSVSHQYGLSIPYDVDKLLKEARLGVFTDLLMLGQKAMNMKDFKGAAHYLEEASAFLGREMSPIAQTALETYRQTFLESMIREGMRLAEAQDYSGAIDMYERTQEVIYVHGIHSSWHIPSLIQEAREGYALMRMDEAENLASRRDFKGAINILKEIDDYMMDNSLAGKASAGLSEVSRDLLGKILQQMDDLNKGKNYGEVLALAGDAWYVCQNFPSSCREKSIQDREGASRRGEYSVMIQESRIALNKGDLRTARARLEEAVSYRNLYAGMVGASTDEDLIAGKIRGEEYKVAVMAGKGHLDRKEYHLALASFDEATHLEKLGGFSPDRKLGEYRERSAVAFILEEADRLARLLDDGQWMPTKDKLLQLMSMRSKYQLHDHQEIEDILNALQSRMVSVTCRNQLAKYDQQMKDAYAWVMKKDFIAASSEIRSAIQTAAEYPECAILDSSAVRYLTQITPAIRYQERMAEAMQLLNDYKNADAVKAYGDAEALFRKGNVVVYGLEHENLEDFAVQQNQNFILSAAFWFRENNDNKATMKMLKALAAQGYPASQTRLLQEQVGFLFGKEDRVQNPASDWKTSVLRHTNGDKQLKYFRKAYKKGWKGK